MPISAKDLPKSSVTGAPQPIKVHNNPRMPPMVATGQGKPSSRKPSSSAAPSGQHPSHFFASFFNGSRQKKPASRKTTEAGLQSDYQNGFDLDGGYSSRKHTTSKPPLAPSRSVREDRGPRSGYREPVQDDFYGGSARNLDGVEGRQSTSSLLQRLTRRKGQSMSQPSSPAAPRKSFFSLSHFGGGAAASSTTQLDGKGRPKSATPQDQLSPPGQLSFAQRIKMHKGLRTTGRVPLDLARSQQLYAAEKEKKKQAKKGGDDLKKSKAFSADAINELDPTYLTEALLAIGDEQPIVARSIPKHSAVIVDPRKTTERLRRDCLFEEEFYDKMLSDSLLVCDLLQSHLSECIVGVRAKSPTALSSPFTSPPQTPILSRSQSAQQQFIGIESGRRSTLPPPTVGGSPQPHRVTISVMSGNGYVQSGMGPRGSAPTTPSGGRPFVRSAALSVAPYYSPSASLPPLSPSMSAAARKKVSPNVHFAA
ncbi:hypothetical protein Ddc_03361 [Ditylenchus destructor]|nr:hypothetical protein Ddc_03361 [Ditylenchus destructor]